MLGSLGPWIQNSAVRRELKKIDATYPHLLRQDIQYYSSNIILWITEHQDITHKEKRLRACEKKDGGTFLWPLPFCFSL